jgi:hypothetical protein
MEHKSRTGSNMAQEKTEQLVISSFPGFDPAVPSGATTGARMPGGNKMKFMSGVEVAPDGSLRWSRDQFKITGPSGKTVESLYEIAFQGANQLLAFCSDGKFYVLNTVWTDTDPVQWTYGYELFAEANTSGPVYFWDAGHDVAEVGLPSAAEMVNSLYIPNPGLTTSDWTLGGLKMWDGANLKAVGLAPPLTACSWNPNKETITVADGYTTVDPIPHQLSQPTSFDRIDFALTGADPCYVYMDKGTGAVGNLSVNFAVEITGGSGGWIVLMGLSDTLSTIWGIGKRADFVWASVQGSTFTLYLQKTTGDGSQHQEKHASGLSLNTVYYCTFTRSGTNLSLSIWDTTSWLPSMTTPTGPAMAVVSLRDYDNNAFEYVTLASSWDGHGAIAGTISDLDLSSTSSTYGNPGSLPAGTYGYYYTFYDSTTGWESMPSPLSGQMVLPVDNLAIKLRALALPTAVNVTERRIYRAFSEQIGGPVVIPTFWGPTAIAGAHKAVGLGLYQYVDSVPCHVNTSGVMTGATTYEDNIPSYALGEAAPYDYALPPWGAEVCFRGDRLWMARMTRTSASYTTQYTDNLQNTLYYSALIAPAYWPGDFMMQVGGATPIVGLHSWNQYLFIFKPDGVWVLSGYNDAVTLPPTGDFSLRQLDANGACAYNAWASSQAGVMWWSSQGLMFFDGSVVHKLVPSVDSALTAPVFSDGVEPKIAYHRGRYYVLSDEGLYWWDPLANTWGCEQTGPITGGIRGVSLGEKQTHLLCLKAWEATTDTPEITVLHTGRAYGSNPAHYCGIGTGIISTSGIGGMGYTLAGAGTAAVNGNDYARVADFDGRHCYYSPTTKYYLWSLSDMTWNISLSLSPDESIPYACYYAYTPGPHIDPPVTRTPSQVYLAVSGSDPGPTVTYGPIGAGSGSGDTDTDTYYAPVTVLLFPLVGGPDEEVELQEVWIDAEWTDVPDSPMVLELSTDASTWTTISPLYNRGRQSRGRANLLRDTVVGSPVYLRITGPSAAAFRLYLVKLIYVRRSLRASVATN